MEKRRQGRAQSKTVTESTLPSLPWIAELTVSEPPLAPPSSDATAPVPSLKPGYAFGQVLKAASDPEYEIPPGHVTPIMREVLSTCTRTSPNDVVKE
jgi:hypothetical protein